MYLRKLLRSQFSIIFLAVLILSLVGLWMNLGLSGRQCVTNKLSKTDDFKEKKSDKNGYECDRAFHQLLYDNLESCKEKLQTAEVNCKSTVINDVHHNDDDDDDDQRRDKCREHLSSTAKVPNNLEMIQINVNNKEKVEGLTYQKQPYVPFSFIKKHFEIHGEFKDDKQTIFEWRHSLIDTKEIGKYSSTGSYLIGNQNGNVELRSKVRHVDGRYEVPVSNQWDKKGYFYPIQISQFGLSHYSRYYLDKIDGKSVKKDLINEDEWKSLKGSVLAKKFNREKGRKVRYFKTKGSCNGDRIFFQPENPNTQKHIISLNIRFESSGMIMVKVLGTDKNIYQINYATDKNNMFYKHPKLFYGIGETVEWRRITRNLNIDFVKGIKVKNSRRTKPGNITLQAILRIGICGAGYMDRVILSSGEHDTMFLSAANWLLKFQDTKGGWAVNVTRKIVKGTVIKPGWYSAMGQGQAISLLCRAYNFTNDKKYLHAASKAVKLFELNVKNGGITSDVMGHFKIYEEYPSLPSFHVLNGFIFSLIGLYDLSSFGKEYAKAKRLYQQGIKTLLHILPLYDNGHGTYYDLRHVAIPGHEPKIARWDYHAVHIKQLQLLNQIQPHKTFESILKRWIGYALGVPAPHN